MNYVVYRNLLESVETEEELVVVILPDFTLSELKKLVDLVYRRDTRLDLVTNQLHECFKLTNIYKELWVS